MTSSACLARRRERLPSSASLLTLELPETSTRSRVLRRARSATVVRARLELELGSSPDGANGWRQYPRRYRAEARGEEAGPCSRRSSTRPKSSTEPTRTEHG